MEAVLQRISVWQMETAGMPPQDLAPALICNRLPRHLLWEWQKCQWRGYFHPPPPRGERGSGNRKLRVSGDIGTKERGTDS